MINPDTGYPVISIAYPIETAGVFRGIASTNITLDVMSKLLDRQKPSPNSITVIADGASTKLRRIAKAMGTKIPRPKYSIAIMMTARIAVATPLSSAINSSEVCTLNCCLITILLCFPGAGETFAN